MAEWKRKQASIISQLELDPANPRMGLPPEATQAEAIRLIFDRHGAYDVATSIAKLGWITHEYVIVVEREGKMVVVEGNRRVAALKGLLNPKLVPAYEKRLAKLATDTPSVRDVKKIEIKVAPTQEQANQLIAALHTQTPRRRWSERRRADFFYKEVAAGRTMNELIESYPTIDVKDYVRTANLFALFRDHIDASRVDLIDYVSDLDDFPVDVYGRLFNRREFLELAGILIETPSYTVSLTKEQSIFTALNTRILDDIKSGTLTTRKFDASLSKPPTYVDLLRSQVAALTGSLPTPPESGGVSDGGDATPAASSDPGAPGSEPHSPLPSPPVVPPGIGGQQNPADGVPTPAQPPPVPAVSPTPTRPPQKLSLDGLVVPIAYPEAMKQIYGELGKINIQTLPTATMDLLRTVLEKTIKQYSADYGGVGIKEVCGRDGRTVGQFVQLGDCLTFLKVILNSSKSSDAQMLKQCLKKLMSPGKKDSWISSAEHLNAINHNPQISCSRDDVLEVWGVLKPLIKYMMNP